MLHHGGPKPSIIISAVLLLLGNWIRYGSTMAGPKGNFGGVMFGQILIGFAQPFVLAAPTRYSDLWFTNRGRIAATAIMSLANPFGGAFAQLIDPFLASDAKDIPNMVLYISIIVCTHIHMCKRTANTSSPLLHAFHHSSFQQHPQRQSRHQVQKQSSL